MKLVIPTYQQTYPHCPQFQNLYPIIFCVKLNTTYRIITVYTQLIHSLCISTDVRCFIRVFFVLAVDSFLKNMSLIIFLCKTAIFIVFLAILLLYNKRKELSQNHLRQLLSTLKAKRQIQRSSYFNEYC